MPASRPTSRLVIANPPALDWEAASQGAAAAAIDLSDRPLGRFRPMRSLLGGVVLALTVIGCGGTVSSPALSPATTTPAALSTAPATPVATSAPSATPEVTAATPSPAPTAVTFNSAAYGYRAVFPAGDLAGAPAGATTTWDGEATVNSDGPYVDKFPRSDGRFLFVYGGPAQLKLAAYAVEAQRLKASWHGCPETAETSRPTTFSGVPALLTSFPCQGLRVFSLYALRDGRALVINQFVSPGDTAAQAAELLDLLSGWTWPG